ncbi:MULTISPECIES: tyrosine-type recombinase/integrase [Marivita]|jgi:integrase|uniref:Tyrosine-type recombinase/integrase n=1 Tax=Marivita cryptomonadis TaxID=505252 RepID=A0A9Q2P4H3_9RHOB|nr:MULTISPECIES: tyrosine-type recombinase/integrase [Marivita]MBM2324363.1 tyrosine-type recombinase/integrase [Marivita cryptomonadis]MBM2333956.1 tyrosine-type recombinase/integrase [Marivita cryptomonadis]MBM2343529.1 tyrosine-type recombinase/integrase [Marivita cryptomonadis]MBM2348207.1 tyrosine-type recombinase/integrase [Marivita cryptomonadis]MBM2352885.1 tyrosine-type recombinase/integrase [Marivita cryptomonadis]
MASEDEKSTSSNSGTVSIAQDVERDQEKSDDISLPAHIAGSGSLDRLVGTARDYARAAASDNTLKAYSKDWANFARWCRMKGVEPLPPSPEMIGLYLADLASGSGLSLSQSAPGPQSASRPLSVSTIERRLSGLAWNYAQRGFSLDRKNRHIATVLAGIKRKHARPPVQKAAILAEDILAMVATLPFDLRGLRDRAILLIGYAGGLRRSEIVTLDVHKDDTPDSGGWIEIFDKGALLTLNAKTGWREVEIGRGSKDQTCPVHALTQWLHFGRVDFGPVFVRISRDGKRASETRLNDKHVARLIKRTVMDAGIRSELPEKDRLALFSGHSLRAGLASSAEVDERYVQKQLGHASAEMTRRYQRRRDRFRVNLTKAAGL